MAESAGVVFHVWRESLYSLGEKGWEIHTRTWRYKKLHFAFLPILSVLQNNVFSVSPSRPLKPLLPIKDELLLSMYSQLCMAHNGENGR